MTIEHTPDGTPYLSDQSYLSETPPYTQELAQIIDAGTGGGVCDIKDSKFNDLQPADPVTPFPIGMFTMWMGWFHDGMWFASTPPNGWLLCDGRSYDETYFSALYEICAAFHGVTDSTFRVPDMRGRVPLGVTPPEWGYADEDSRPTRTIIPGDRWGDWRIQKHVHQNMVGWGAGSSGYPLWDGASDKSAYGLGTNTGTVTGVSGMGQNMTPYTGVNFIVYTGKPTLDTNGDILPECGQGEPMLPMSTRGMIEDRLAQEGITEEEVKMLKEQLEEIKKTEAK